VHPLPSAKDYRPLPDHPENVPPFNCP